MTQIRKNTLILTMTFALLTIALVANAYAQNTTATLTTSATNDNGIITVTGIGFNASENIALELLNSDGTLAYNFTEAITTDTSGNFAANVTLPTNVYGTFNLTASASNITAYTQYTISQPATTATLTTSATNDNGIITVTGIGFNASENIALELLNSDGTLAYNFTEAITTDTSGNFAANVTLPTNVYGTFNLTASASNITAYTQYTISQPATTYSSLGVLSATPDNSNIIEVSGSGFNASENVWLGLTDSNGNIVYNFTELVASDAQGNFSAITIVPTNISGTYNLFASTSSATAYTAQTIPDFTGPTGSPGVTGATGETGAAADSTISYAAVALSILAIAIAAYTLMRKH